MNATDMAPGDNRMFYRRAKWVTVAHALVILFFLVWPLVAGYFRPEPVTIVPIEFVVDTRTLQGEPEEGEGDEAAPEPPQPAPPKTVPPKPEAPQPSPPAPKPAEVRVTEAKPKPAPPAAVTSSKPKVKVSSKKVKRPGRTPNPLTPEEIRARLALGARAGNYNSAIPGENERNFGLVYQALYRAWEQPSRDAVGGRTVTAALRLGADGLVLDPCITRPSGIPEFDRSVQAALDAVVRIPGLSPTFLAAHRQVTILFEVE